MKLVCWWFETLVAGGWVRVIVGENTRGMVVVVLHVVGSGGLRT